MKRTPVVLKASEWMQYILKSLVSSSEILCLHELRRQFLSLIEMEQKKKKAAVDATQYLEKLAKDIDLDRQRMKKQLEDLASILYVNDQMLRHLN